MLDLQILLNACKTSTELQASWGWEGDWHQEGLCPRKAYTEAMICTEQLNLSIYSSHSLLMPGFTKDTHTNLSSQVILWISWYHDIQVSSHTRPHSRDKAISSCAFKLGLMQTFYAAPLPVILCSITYLSAKGKRGKTSLKSPHTTIHFCLQYRAPLAYSWNKDEMEQEMQAAAERRAEVRCWKRGEWQNLLAQRSSMSTGATQLWHLGKEQQMDQTDAHLLGRSGWLWAMVLCGLGSGEALKHTGTGLGHQGDGHKPKGKSWHGHRAERAAVPYHRPPVQPHPRTAVLSALPLTQERRLMPAVW